MTIQPFDLLEQWDRLARDEQQPAQVDAELQVDVLRLQRLDRAADPDAGRVDEHVHPAEALGVCSATTRTQSSSLLVSAAIAVRVELGCGRFDLLACAGGERQLESFFAQHARDREADPRRSSGDECARHDERI